MAEFFRTAPSSLVKCIRNLATMAEDDLRRFVTEAAQDRDGATLWALTKAHLTPHGSSGSRVSPHTLAAYRHAVAALLDAWQGCEIGSIDLK